MKTQLIVCLILGLMPYHLSAQDNTTVLVNSEENTPDKEEDSKLFKFIEFTISHAQARRNSRSVVLYSEKDFYGENFVLNRDWSSRHHASYWNDQIASIEIPEGWEVWLYEHTDFRGRALVISEDWSVRDNPWWRNRISSIRLVDVFDQNCEPQPRRTHREHQHRHGHHRERGVTVYNHSHFDGASKTIYDDWSKRNSDDFWNNRISSIDVPSGYVVILYKHSDFEGRSLKLKGPCSVKLDNDSWNNKVSSIEVYRR